MVVVSSHGLPIRTDKICCIGAGYVGGPTMAVLASRCPHLEVHVVDISESRIAAWNSDKLPIYEPGLDEIVRECRGKNLFFSTDTHKAVEDCDIIFVSVNTPTKRTGMGAGCAADLQYWEATGRMIAETATSSKIIVEKSTVPVRTAEALRRVLTGSRRRSSFEGQEGSPSPPTPSPKFFILSNPEFLAEGTAISDLQMPDRVLIGGITETEEGLAATQVLAEVYKAWVPEDRILTTNLWSSELSKLVANAMLAQRVSSVNAVSQLCAKTGANVSEVARAVGSDSRIGGRFLQASVGFGGSCFQKDILNLVYICESFGLLECADYWRQVVLMNNSQKFRFSENIIKSMFGSLGHKKIALLGAAFKKDTGDVRETCAIDVARFLIDDGACLTICDPQVCPEDFLNELRDKMKEGPFLAPYYCHTPVPPILSSEQIRDQIRFTRDPMEAVKDAHAIVLVTEWDCYHNSQSDYRAFYDAMEKPAFVFDGRNMLDAEALQKIGFEVHGVGRKPLLQVWSS